MKNKKPADRRERTEAGKREAPPFSFEGKYWWIPAAISGMSIVLSALAIYLSLSLRQTG